MQNSSIYILNHESGNELHCQFQLVVLNLGTDSNVKHMKIIVCASNNVQSDTCLHHVKTISFTYPALRCTHSWANDSFGRLSLGWILSWSLAASVFERGVDDRLRSDLLGAGTGRLAEAGKASPPSSLLLRPCASNWLDGCGCGICCTVSVARCRGLTAAGCRDILVRAPRNAPSKFRRKRLLWSNDDTGATIRVSCHLTGD